MTNEDSADLVLQGAAVHPVQIEVRTLAVAPLSRESLRLGNIAGLASFAERHAGEVRAVVWNEEGLRLAMESRGLEVAYVPEVYPETAMFLSREHKREREGFGGPSGLRVWQGEYEPVLFAKKDLVKFLAKHSSGDAKLLASVKTLRVTQRREETEEMLDLETDDVRRVQEESESTNVPRHFTLQMPVTEDIDAVFEFEASLYKPEKDDDWQTRSEAQHKRIAVRMVNARSVLRGVMETVLARLPSGIPSYYGRHSFVDPGGGR